MIIATRSLLTALLLFAAFGGFTGHAATSATEPDRKAAESDLVQLTPAQIAMAGVKSEPAKTAPVGDQMRFPAEVALNANRVAEIVPRVGGRVRAVKADLGQNISNRKSTRLNSSH